MHLAKRFSMLFVVSALIMASVCGAAWAYIWPSTDAALANALTDTKNDKMCINAQLHITSPLAVDNTLKKFLYISSGLLEINNGATLTIPSGAYLGIDSYRDERSLLKISGQDGIIVGPGGTLSLGEREGIHINHQGSITVQNGATFRMSTNFGKAVNGGYVVFTDNSFNGKIYLAEGAKVLLPEHVFVRNGVAFMQSSITTVRSDTETPSESEIVEGEYTYDKDHRVYVKGYRGNISNTTVASTYTVNAKANYSSRGTVTASPTTAAEGNTVTLKATPNTNYAFDHWEVSPSTVSLNDRYSETTSFKMPPSNVTATAVFSAAPASYTVSVTASPSVGGSVASSVSKAAYGTRVTLTATPREGYHFVRWQSSSGISFSSSTSSSTSFTMPNNSVSVTGVFEANLASTYTISVNANSSSGGTVKASASSAVQGSRITLTATPNDGYRFVRWEASSSSKISFSSSVKPTATFTMPNNAVSITAVFEARMYSISVSASPKAGGTASANMSSAEKGMQIRLTASPSSGYIFSRWEPSSSSGVTVSGRTSETATFTMPSNNVSVTAIFTKSTPIPTPAPVPTPRPSTSPTPRPTYSPTPTYSPAPSKSGDSGGGCSDGFGAIALITLAIVALRRK